MKFLTFSQSAGPELGGLTARGQVVPLSRLSHDPDMCSMLALISGGEAALVKARELIEAAKEVLDPGGVKWLAPLPAPPQIRDFLVFEEHMRMAGWRGAQLRERWGAPPAPIEPLPIPDIWYKQPIYYKCNRFAVTGSGETVQWPTNSTLIDYELELACVISRQGKDISSSEAEAHIFGYTIFNDLTARDLQFREMQGPLGPAKGKDFDGANVFGPVIVTADELDISSGLRMRAYVNDELWSEGNSSAMHWSFGDIIEHVSRSETLYPGEILGSGTVGAGCGLEQGRFLVHDDLVTLEVEGIGRVTTRIHAPHVRERMIL